MFHHYDGRAGSLRGDPFKACVVPRPIGWISSMDASGRLNLAPFSYFNAVSEEPHRVMFCANGSHVEGGEKDSVRNVRETGEFVANLATWELREAMNLSSAALGRAVNEFEFAQLATAPSTLVKPPRVAATPIALECRLEQIVELAADSPDELNRMVIGRVLGIHIDDALIDNGRVSIARMRPIARLGYRQYAVVDHVFEMTRPAGIFAPRS